MGVRRLASLLAAVHHGDVFKHKTKRGISMRSARFAMSYALLLLSSACAPMLKVNVLQPAPVNLGVAKHLTVLQAEGRRSARERVVQEFLQQARSSGYFQVTDRSEEGITVKLVGQTVATSGGSGPEQAPDAIGLRIDVLEWTTSQKVQKEDITDKKGKVTGQREVVTYEGKALLGVTAFSAQGKVHLAEKEYVGKQEAEREDNALHGATRNAIAALLADITPQYVPRHIRLDGDDKAQEPIIKLAEKGNAAKAVEEMRAYLAQNPQNPVALYNLAALLDASGQYQEALDLYNKAIAGSNKDFYVKMKSDCTRRLGDQQALAQ